MSVMACRWVKLTLKHEPRPNKGGLSHAARAVLMALASDANCETGESFTSAPTLEPITGYSERNVRHAFDELEAWHLPRRARAGRSDVWSFPPARPRSVATGVDAAVPRSVATGVDPDGSPQPRSVATGVKLSTPRSDTTLTPVGSDRRRVLRDVVTKRDAVQRGALPSTAPDVHMTVAERMAQILKAARG